MTTVKKIKAANIKEIEDAEIIIDDSFLKTRPLSYSSGKHFRRSPLHYKHYITEPRKAPSDAMLIGSATDIIVLQPELFDKKIRVYRKFSKRSNADKERWQEMMVEANTNKFTWITEEIHESAKCCAGALTDNIEARKYIDHKGRVQVRIDRVDKEHNIPIVGYLDFEAYDQEVIVDIKTGADVRPDKHIKQTYGDLEYYLQWGCYLDHYQKKYFKFPSFVHINVETTAPYGVSVMVVEPKDEEFGKAEWRGTLKAFRYCLDNKLFWQSYEFWLFGTRDHYALRKPGWLKPKTANY